MYIAANQIVPAVLPVLNQTTMLFRQSNLDAVTTPIVQIW